MSLENLIFRENGTPIVLSNLIHSGPKSNLWDIQGSKGFVAKIYKRPHPKIGQKILHMIQNPPSDPFATKDHFSFAWPTGRLFNHKGNCCGFFMPKLQNFPPLSQICHPKIRAQLPLS